MSPEYPRVFECRHDVWCLEADGDILHAMHTLDGSYRQGGSSQSLQTLLECLANSTCSLVELEVIG